jgi:hypothetical protein
MTVIQPQKRRSCEKTKIDVERKRNGSVNRSW